MGQLNFCCHLDSLNYFISFWYYDLIFIATETWCTQSWFLKKILNHQHGGQYLVTTCWFFKKLLFIYIFCDWILGHHMKLFFNRSSKFLSMYSPTLNNMTWGWSQMKNAKHPNKLCPMHFLANSAQSYTKPCGWIGLSLLLHF